LDGTYDAVLLCCKAYDLMDAISAIAPAMDEQSVILPFLNGIRHIDVLTERFGPQRVLGGLTVINAALMPDGTIQQSELRINITAIEELDGRISSRCTAIKMALEAGGIPVQVSDDIVAGMWMKFFGFTCNATIACLSRSRAGAIASSGAGESFVSAVLEECTRAATAEGYPPPPDTAGIIRGIFSQPNSTYGPSLLIDMEGGRPTEGEHTIGDMMGRATRRGVNVPLLSGRALQSPSLRDQPQQSTIKCDAALGLGPFTMTNVHFTLSSEPKLRFGLCRQPQGPLRSARGSRAHMLPVEKVVQEDWQKN
jgi:2-dehydropantoate 2-reductase